MSLTLFLAYILDEYLGEPKRYHPLVGFGNVAYKLELFFYSSRKYVALTTGALAWCLVILPVVTITYVMLSYLPTELQFIVNAIILYLTLGQNSLKQHGMAVYQSLMEKDLTGARDATSMIVSRDTSQSNEQQLATATVETVTENTHDAVIAPLFYFLVFGAAGAVLFRLANTLDAMWGYRNTKYEYFGKFSARMDDVLGYIPARITTALFVLANPRQIPITLKSIFGNGRKWYSPNAGIVMAAGAGALNIRLGGDAIYNGKEKARLTLGFGHTPCAKDIKRSITLMYVASGIFLVLAFLIELMFRPALERMVWP